MRSLLDVNVLIALFDQQHSFHQRARTWLEGVIDDGWSSCPITQAGFARVISDPRYPANVTTPQAIQMLDAATSDNHHQFWAADIALVADAIDRQHVLGPGQIAGAYLLALAVSHGGRLVTFDQRMDRASVPTASPQHLLIL